MCYAVQTFRVIFLAKISLDLFSLGLKQLLTYSIFSDHTYETKEVTGSGPQGIKTRRSSLLYIDPW